MPPKIKIVEKSETSAWDNYVYNHPHGTVYHLSGWGNVIHKTYGHDIYYLMATDGELICEAGNAKVNKPNHSGNGTGRPSIVGILPLVHLKHFVFGNSLISVPFFDFGGILADYEEAEIGLLQAALSLGRKLKVDNIELRHIRPLDCVALDHGLQSHSFKVPSWVSEPPLPPELPNLSGHGAVSCCTRSHKVRMLLSLPESPEILMKSFKSKLRSQIKKPVKEGLVSKIGGVELIGDFYKVFSINMRDLGSPVHSKRIMENVLAEFPDRVNTVVVYRDDQPMACSITVGFKDTLENPWASARREFSRYSPNMLLYWTMLDHACSNGFSYFDFGRSSPDEGTYKFKKQWGAIPTVLHWHSFSLNGSPMAEGESDKSRFNKAIQYWQKLPVPVANILGPMIRKHIGL